MILNASNSINPIARQYFDKVRSAGGDVYDKDIVNKAITRLSQVINPAFWALIPMKLTQNIQSGTIQYSAGLAAENVNLVNAPIRQIDGTSFNGSTQYGTFKYLNFKNSTNVTIFDRIKPTNGSAAETAYGALFCWGN